MNNGVVKSSSPSPIRQNVSPASGDSDKLSAFQKTTRQISLMQLPNTSAYTILLVESPYMAGYGDDQLTAGSVGGL
jgi:hypothetical protein